MVNKEFFGETKNIEFKREIPSKREKFLKDIFELEFKTYLFRSRTLIVARVTREILSSENDHVYKNKLYNFIQEKIENLKEETKNEKNEFDGWI